MELYKIQLSMEDGSKVNWIREGLDMEATLKSSKVEARAKFLDVWTGGISIVKKFVK